MKNGPREQDEDDCGVSSNTGGMISSWVILAVRQACKVRAAALVS